MSIKVWKNVNIRGKFSFNFKEGSISASAMSIHRILTHKKWHFFKIKITNELTEDPDRKIELRQNNASI